MSYSPDTPRPDADRTDDPVTAARGIGSASAADTDIAPHHAAVDDTTDAGSARDPAIQTRDEAKERAADVRDSAVEASRHVADVAKDRAGDVAAEAGRHLQGLVTQTKREANDQLATQQQRLAGGLHTLSEEFHSMGSGNDQSGFASDLARQAGDRAHRVAAWLEDREPADVLDEVRSFARRRPGMFIALAAGAGVLAGRLVRGLKDDSAGAESEPARAGTLRPPGDEPRWPAAPTVTSRTSSVSDPDSENSAL